MSYHESMENALRACCKGIKIGKILIHHDGDNGKHLILKSFLRIFQNGMSSFWILFLLQVSLFIFHCWLLMHQLSCYPSFHLFLFPLLLYTHPSFSFIQAPEGIHCVCKRFPSLKIVTSEIDVALNREFRVIPGMGEFGDRYFGTDD
ncbi:hypothetical protein Goarm_003153 [Gossypium armourianum]|uniref:Phosphoribosyltransferase domain-containing protein n=1 Tax=Gossypium armourianum TaxID=34283 RepID=A0A7J9K2A5_9ROSI|nr:hypothetical protein [Gossypium armourianum]